MFGANEIEQLLAGVSLLDHAIPDVGAVDAGHEHPRRPQLQPLDDLGARLPVGGGGERNARHPGEPLVQHRELDVLRAKIVPPLRHAVRLVDGEQRQRALLEQRQATLGKQPLGGHVHQVQLATPHRSLDVGGLRRAQRGVEVCRAHAEFGERRHLIVHEGDERRHHHAHTVAQQRRNLVAQRLAAAGGHQHQRVAAIGDVRYHVGLVTAKRRVAEDGVEEGEGVVLQDAFIISSPAGTPQADRSPASARRRDRHPWNRW